MRLWEDARDAPPPVRLPAGTHKTFRQLVNAEHEAQTERTVESSVVPGMLQTEEYMRSLVVAAQRFGDPSARADAVVTTRPARQRRLIADDPLQLHAVIDEAVIRRTVGGSAVMREQLEYLLDVGGWDNVTLQAVRFDAGSYGQPRGLSSLSNIRMTFRVCTWSTPQVGRGWRMRTTWIVWSRCLMMPYRSRWLLPIRPD